MIMSWQKRNKSSLRDSNSHTCRSHHCLFEFAKRDSVDYVMWHDTASLGVTKYVYDEEKDNAWKNTISFHFAPVTPVIQ